jgi:uncharacterized protein YecT (DUF1311 family)
MIAHRRLSALGIVYMAVAVPAGATGTVEDVTNAALTRCLAAPSNASTAGQTDCEAVADRSYDHRMNVAYRALMRRLPASAANRLRQSQRAWLTYRDAEASARSSIYATRQGTMYVPMEGNDAVTVSGDRARLLEGYVQVLDIE